MTLAKFQQILPEVLEFGPAQGFFEGVCVQSIQPPACLETLSGFRGDRKTTPKDYLLAGGTLYVILPILLGGQFLQRLRKHNVLEIQQSRKAVPSDEDLYLRVVLYLQSST